MHHLALFRTIALLSWLSLLISCGSDGYNPAATGDGARGELVSADVKTSHSALTLQTNSKSYGFDAYSSKMQRAVTTYKLVYWTVDTAGTPIKASGLLAVPLGSEAGTTKLVSYQHGTIIYDNYAPSHSSDLDMLSAMLASMNFVVALPDYLGYGESVALLHPYMHADSLAKAGIDMLRAAKSFMNSNSIGFSDQLLLGGYSEGGYAAVAMHKMIEEQHADEFTILATAAGAGAYDMSGTADTLLNYTNLPYPAYVAFVFKAYDEIYGFHRISEIFSADYVATINNDFYGTVNDSVVNSKLTPVTATLFKTDFLTSFRSTGETEIKARLAENDIVDWTPLAPLLFFHGQDDTIVLYANTQTAYDTMLTNGATDVTIEDCVPKTPPANHANCYLPYLFYMTDYFLNL